MFELFSISISVMLILFGGFVLQILAAEFENTAFSLASFFITLTVLEIFGVPIWATILAHPISVFTMLLLYILIGVFYSALYSWPNYIDANASKIERGYKNWKNVYKTGNFEGYVSSADYPFIASDHKNKIISWMITWPFAATWELSHKPITKLWDTAYTLSGKLFNAVSHKRASRYKIDD